MGSEMCIRDSLRRSRRRPASPSRRRGRRCGVYSPPDVAWWRSVGPAGQGLAYICAPAAMRRVAVPDPPERNAGTRTRRSGRHVEVPDNSTGGGPELRLRVLSVPRSGAHGNAGPLPEQARGHTCGEVESGQPEVAEL